MACSHLLCRLRPERDGRCCFAQLEPHQGSKFGSPPSSEPPPETVALVQQLLARLDRRVLHAEVKRLDALDAVEKVINTLASEQAAIAMQWDAASATRRSALVDRVKRWCEGSDAYQVGDITVKQRTADSLRASTCVGGDLDARWHGDGNSFTVELRASDGQFEPEGAPQLLQVIGAIEWRAFVDWVNEVDRAIHGKA
jgi:hypothetical protein